MSTQELELAPATAPDIKTMKLANPESAFDEFSNEITPILEQSKALTIADANKLAVVKVADEYRKDVKKLRCAVEARRKELVADLNKQTKDINTAAGKLWDICEKEEARLLEIVEHAEREVVRIQDEKRTARAAELTPFLSSVPAVDLGALTDEQYAAMLTDAKDAHSARLAREKKEKEEAEAKAKAEAEERERIRLENERLKKEAAEREAQAKKEREEAAAKLKAEQDRAAKEKAAIEDKARQEAIAASKAREEEQRKFEAEAKKQREEAAERERVAREAADKENARLAAIAEQERQKAATAAREAREAREKIEAEAEAKKAAEAKAAAAKKAAEEAAALAPEKDKLKAFAACIRALLVPTLETEKGVTAAKEISEKVESFAKWIEKQAASL